MGEGGAGSIEIGQRIKDASVEVEAWIRNVLVGRPCARRGSRCEGNVVVGWLGWLDRARKVEGLIR
jgi:hypothetical protein